MYQNCLEQSQKHVCNGAYDRYNHMETRLKTIDYNAGEACGVVIKVFTCIKTAWNRVRNMFATVLTTITTIWRPGLKQLITMLVKLAMLYQSVHMCQNCQDRVGNMFAMVLTIITTIRRPGFGCGLCWISTNSCLENFFSQDSHFNIVTVFQLFYTSSLITVS